MRKAIASLAAVAALGLSAPVLGQNDATILDAGVAMDCGIANAYLAGVIEEEDPGFSGELLEVAGVWLAMSAERFSGADTEYDARVETRTNELTKELGAMNSEDAIAEFFTTILSSCEMIRDANSAEYDRAAAIMAAEG